jgi:hypothetical protein
LEIAVVLELLKVGNAFLPGSASGSSGGCGNPSRAGDGEFQNFRAEVVAGTRLFFKERIA